jgi:hypothetical protein
MEKDLRTANGPIRHLEFLRNFNTSFRTFKALPTTCPESLQMRKHVFWKHILRKKGSGRPTKRTIENIEEVERGIAETLIRRLAQ